MLLFVTLETERGYPVTWGFGDLGIDCEVVEDQLLLRAIIPEGYGLRELISGEVALVDLNDRMLAIYNEREMSIDFLV